MTIDFNKASFGEALAYVITHRADQLTERFARDEGDKLYRYMNGKYARHAERWIRSQVKAAVQNGARPKQWTKTSAENVVAWIAADAPMLEPPVPDYINVQNGLLRIADRTLLPHEPNYFTSVQLPVMYDPEATCPRIDECIAQWFPEDATPLAYEIPGYLAVADTNVQQAILLLGPGGNGKSRYLEMVRRFLGPPNVSSLSLHKLESDRFAVARLIGKLANICPDLPSEHLAGTSVFKNITGGDTLQAEYKFRESFDFTPFCRLVFSANSPPKSKDYSPGFFDRWKVVPFTNVFRGERDEIPQGTLDDQLSLPCEQAGLLNAALDGLDRMRQRGMRLHSCESTELAHRQFHAVTDALAVWLDGYTIDHPDMVVPCTTMRREFNEFCHRTGRSAMNDTDFGRKVRTLRPDIERKQRTVSGRLQWCYVGIGMKEAA